MPGSRRSGRGTGSAQEGAPSSACTSAAPLLPGKLWVQTTDGEVKEVEGEMTALLFRNESMRSDYNKGKGREQSKPVQLPKQVTPDTLKLLLEYCQFHRAAGRSDKERKLFDEKFIKLDTNRLCELTSAADSLELKQLVELTSKALAKMIEGKSPEEIRETFHLPDDLTEEEKLEPVKNWQDDRRIRLLNRLYAKKRKALAEQKAKLRQAQNNQAGHQEQLEGAEALLQSPQILLSLPESAASAQDNRSVEELLSFIGGQDESGKSKAKSKKKKKSKRKGSDGADGLQMALMADDQACATSDPHAPNLGQHAAANPSQGDGIRWGGARDLSDASLAHYDDDFMDEDDEDDHNDDDDHLLDDMDSFIPGLHPSWHEAGNGALSGPPLGSLHLRVTTLTSLSQFRPKLPPAVPSLPIPGPTPHSQEARRQQSGEQPGPASMNGPARGRNSLKSPGVAARAQSSSSSLSGSEASEGSSRGSASSTMQVSSCRGGAAAESLGRQIAEKSRFIQLHNGPSQPQLSRPSDAMLGSTSPLPVDSPANSPANISKSSSHQSDAALAKASSLHSIESAPAERSDGDAGATLRVADGQELAPLGAQDALRVASALEDFLRMLGLHEQLQVIPSSCLLGACRRSLQADREPKEGAPSESDAPAITSGRQLHVQRVLPSGRSVALSVS
ncbi:hypothetical protein WJX74_002556 [Apatococcus lobatus]|uniref:SKP1 component dimerisation domain-containing protein n=1 Tax=Apatococcus lobatus TaxID=904363 RepID=A0AAW1REA3_9CHLO